MHAPHERPHVSPALVHTRTWVSLASLLIVLACAAQMLIFALVHYTSIRTPPDTGVKPATALVVVNPGGAARIEQPLASKPATAGNPSGTTAASGGTNGGTSPSEAANVQPADAVLRGGSAIATTAGILGAMVLLWMTALGAVVAAGASVPGVDRVVRASAFALVLTVVCLPLGQLLGSDVLPGVFSTYGAIAAASDLVRSGRLTEWALICQYILLPVAAIALTGYVAWWFRVGTEAGVICTSVNDMDEKLAAEMASVRKGGATTARGHVRAVGALNQAIGASVVGSPIPSAPPPDAGPMRRSLSDDDAELERVSGRRPRRINEPDAGDGLKRLI